MFYDFYSPGYADLHKYESGIMKLKSKKNGHSII